MFVCLCVSEVNAASSSYNSAKQPVCLLSRLASHGQRYWKLQSRTNSQGYMPTMRTPAF